MPRRPVAPIAGRGQAVSTRVPAPTQMVHPSALLVPVDQLVPDPGQPRRHFNEEALEELTESIKQQGILQPLLVREDGALPDGRSRYVIIAGGRRHRAAQSAGLAAVPVIVHAETSNSDLRILQLIENLQREELDELEEAVAIRELMQLADLSLAEVASRIGKTKAYAQRRVDLLYDPRLTEAVRHGMINASVALELRRFSHEQRSRYLERIAAGERLEVAQLREEKRRAHEILFGDVKRQRTGAAGQSPDGAEHSDGSAPRAGESYRIDTAAATEQSLDTPPETPGAGQATEIDGTPSDDPWMNDGAKSYRFDTIRDDSASPSSPDTESVLEPNLQSSSTRNGYADDAGAAAWAARIVDEILLPDRQGPLHQAELTTAVQAWRSAGSPAGWGDSLLHILAERLGCQ